MNLIEQLHRQWSTSVGQPQAHTPVPGLSEPVRALRNRLHKEEMNELLEAMYDEPVEQIGKEALDCIWVGVGTLITLGWDLNTAFYELYRSNMSKLDANGRVIKDGGGKVMKGPNYRPPDFSCFKAPVAS